MIKKGRTAEEVEVMRNKLVEFEGWEENALLPEGWLFKVHWEGFVPHKNSVQSNLSFLSRDIYFLHRSDAQYREMGNGN